MTWEVFFKDYLDDVIALLALVVAILSAIYTYRHSGKSISIQEDALKIEKLRDRKAEDDSKKAKFEVSLSETGGSAPFKLDSIKIINRGKDDAKNMQVFINNISLDKHPKVYDTSGKKDKITLNAGIVMVIRFTHEFDVDKVTKVKIIWDDRAGKNNQEEFELTL